MLKVAELLFVAALRTLLLMALWAGGSSLLVYHLHTYLQWSVVWWALPLGALAIVAERLSRTYQVFGINYKKNLCAASLLGGTLITLAPFFAGELFTVASSLVETGFKWLGYFALAWVLLAGTFYYWHDGNIPREFLEPRT